MNLFARIFHRRSLTFSFIALCFGLMAFGGSKMIHVPGREPAPPPLTLCILSWLVCLTVLVNLIRDVERGYSPPRCSLAAVIMLAAFIGNLSLAFAVAHYYLRA